MRRGSISTWLIVVWTLAMACLSLVTLSNPELRRLDVAVGAIMLGAWWLTGMAPLTLVWIVAHVLRARRAGDPSADPD